MKVLGMTLVLVGFGAVAGAQGFEAKVLVTERMGEGGKVVTIDMCASTGRGLQFAWDYDGDTNEDQRGPCRREMIFGSPGVFMVNVGVWETEGKDRQKKMETIWVYGPEPEPAVMVENGPEGEVVVCTRIWNGERGVEWCVRQ